MIKKSYLGAAILLVGFAFSFQSCKKGENDPISLKSRIDRLKGDWVLTQKDVVQTDASNSGQISISTITINGIYNGQEETVHVNDGTSMVTRLFKYDFTITFNEDGTYSYTLNFYRPVGGGLYQNNVYISTGVWAWLDQGKDKLGISLSTDYPTTAPDTLDAGTMMPYNIDGAYNIDRLASDELILKRTGQNTTTIDTIITNKTFDGTFTFGR